MSQDDDPGFERMPDRYRTASGREAIDIIREQLGDPGFLAFCRGTEIKYRLRAGRKAGADNDAEKARWYAMMADHVAFGAPDPRSYRAGGGQ